MSASDRSWEGQPSVTEIEPVVYEARSWPLLPIVRRLPGSRTLLVGPELARSGGAGQDGAMEDLSTAQRDWEQRWRSEDGRRDWLETEPEVEAVIPHLLRRGARRVLDLGCGVGRHSLALARAGLAVTAVDASESGLAALDGQAEAAELSVTTRRADMRDLPFEDGSFDYILSWNVIYHGDRPVVERSIAEIRRLLAPGGLFQGTLLSKRHSAFGVGREIAPDTWVDEEAGDSDKAHPHFYCEAVAIAPLFRGFSILDLTQRPQAKPGSYHFHLLALRD